MPESTSPEPPVAIPSLPDILIYTLSPSETIVLASFNTHTQLCSLEYVLAVSIGLFFITAISSPVRRDISPMCGVTTTFLSDISSLYEALQLLPPAS